ncbi:MAG: hypothetical protein DHS20C13_22270 [Thermodesulfobacteriota bacterium]|nr:MAG: hypothetical protein DHS20C13_22270 [Thermodesulfobacteriota bacterium]
MRLIDLEEKENPNILDHKKFGWLLSRQSDEEKLELENTYKLSYWSRYLLACYAGLSYEYLNQGLRYEKWIPCTDFCREYKFYLNKVLDDLPSYNSETVWRWVVIEEEGFEYLKNFVGKTIMTPQFLSTSTYKNESGYQRFFRIETQKSNSSAKYICPILGKSKASEKEVLFKSNTVFEIIDYDNDTIYMKEYFSEKGSLILYEYFWNDNLIPYEIGVKLGYFKPESPKF